MKNDTLKGFCALVVTIVTLLVFSTNHASAFDVITGSVTEISGPDDLKLNPDKAIIAVDVFGDSDRSVNGVTFFTDRADRGDGVVEEGKVQSGDVSVTTAAANSIDNWAGAQAFTGGTEGSAANLAEIMRDIRWNGAPNPVNVTVAGLTAESIYTVQLLFNEGADRDRGWDIAVNGDLAVDNFGSEGGDGTWTNANSFSYNVNATATAEGTIAVSLQNNIGGADQVAADGNPILQAVIVSSYDPPKVLVDIDLTDDELGELASIPNTGTLGGTFDAEVDTPSVTEVDGVKAVTLDGTNDWYVGPDSAPLTGDADRTVEAWVFNPELAAEETIVAWGRRGGGDGTNWSMLYGSHNTWGSLGGWGGAADMPFVAGQAGGPEAGKWHHLTLSYNKSSNTRSIYVDGFLSNSENDGNPLNTWAVANDNETPLPIVIGNQNEANGTRVDNLSGSLSIAKLKIYDQALDASTVFSNFDGDRSAFGLGGPLVASFSSESSAIIGGQSTTLSWNILGADSISIDNGVGDVSGTTSVSVSPSESTTYTLTAADADGIEKTASVDIKVTLPSPSSAVVIHQWKFEEEGGAGTTLVDSVGSADGTIVDVGGNDGTVGGGSVTLAGGGKNDSDYVKLPSGLISSLSSASIETWVTQKSAQNWSRVFSVGSASNNVMHMSFTKGGNINENEWRWNAQSNITLGNFGGQPTNPIDEQVHWVVTLDDTAGEGDKTKVTIYKNGTEVSTGETDNNLSGLNDRDFFLGRSQWGDNAANASWDEFRIYNGALTADQVDLNNTAGPDGEPPAAPPAYSNDFNEYADGTTDLGDGSTIFGAAARVLGGRLQLTRDGEGLGFSSFTVPAMKGTSKGFTATFDYELFDSPAANDPADGFSFNYGNAPVGDQGQAEEGMAGRPGVTENLSFEVDTWRNNDAEQGVNISGLVNGDDVGQLAFTNGVILEDGSRKTGSMEIRWDPSKGATFLSTGLTTNADFTDVDTGAFVGDDGYNFIISARVGGANQDLFIDNLIITAGKPTPAPLPAVTAYYDFEGHDGNTVADKGVNGLNAEINRPDQLTIGGSGAPKGSTPGTGADFQGGFLNVAGADMAGVINDVEGQNSYTLSAWIKPSDLGGNKFLWGQTSQGIHNGIRNGGFLHQAHWGADTNGATNLNTLAGEWVHAAWVYDGAADIGRMYLNGNLDYEGDKRAPNGSGNLIIGGSNGGGDNYRGLVDDIAVWNQVLTGRQIQAIAGGQSPINLAPLDEDGDGINDATEIALVGNTTDLGAGPGSKGVSFNSDRDNAIAAMDADTVAGVVPSTGWVSTDGGADAAGGANGSITNGFTVDWSSNGTWNTNNGAADGDDKLMNGYIDAIGGDGAAQVKISGINGAFADGYDLYVYFGSDGNNRTGKIALEGGATYSFNTFSQQGGDFPAQYTQTTDEADGNPQSNYAVYSGLTGDAQTVNLIRGSSNSGFHGIQIVGTTTGDYDGDGLTDVAELEGATSPLDPDGDDDGLSDGAEVAAGTNPNNPDSDNDGVNDGAEITAGTDPTNSDSDGDGFSDGSEIAKGSDPTSSDSVPPLPAPIAYYNFEDKSSTALDRSFNGNSATVSGNITFVDEGAPNGASPNAAASMAGGHWRVPGIDMNSQIRDSGDGSYTMSAWIKPDSTDGERFIFGQTNQGIHNGIRNNAFLHQAHWGADTNGATNLNDYLAAEGEDGWIHAAFVYDGATDTGRIYLDGQLDWEGGKRAANGSGHLIIGGRNNGERNYTGLIDEVAIWDAALAGPEVADLAAGGSPISSLPDEDGDGFLDAWETKYAANLDVLGGNKDASLLTYLNFDNQANDQSGNGLNGTLSGPAAFSADAEGFSGAAGDYAINLGAINDKSAVIIENATLESALNNNTMAVSFWQNNTQVGNTSSFWIHSPSAGANERGFQAHVPWGNGTIFFDQSGCCGGGQRLTAAGKIIVNQWQHFVFQRDADGNQEIWVDGEKAAEALGTAEALEAFTKITIGAEGNNNNNSLAGRLDEFAVWNRKLTAEEITTLQSSATTEILNLTPSDADGDGLTDAEEYASQASDPTKADSDDDGLSDTQEIALGTQPLNPDSDGDGLNDGAEGTAGTDPLNSDSDSDGYADGDEIKTGTDPLDSDSTPPNLIAYFNFERSSGSSVADLSAWGNDATVGRPDQTTLGVAGGAPNGPSPATAIQLQDGLLNVPGVDLSDVIGGEGSYTFTAWIKPTDLGGDKFLFGQSSQGIHNGIRNNGFLHQAHWGADTNGATNLNDYDASANDGWIHAAWTYDGATNTGKIYLDGVEDYSGDKNQPNGSGNLIIGGRNGGGNGYVGLVDEVAVWNVAAGAEYIAKLAAGQSPLDDDGDGLPDAWAAGFGVTDPDGDADEDGVSNADEFLVGTDPTNTDSDGDGTADGDEILGGFDPADDQSLPLPAAIAYYNFEGDSDSIVIDRTFNGNNATVGKAAQTTLGVEGGAPGGASPGKAANLQDGLLRTPIDATPIIQGDGSYTFTAWIKPSDLGGDKFLFGQTSQGIHNGIRNGGFLHQAHWGADTNGATNLKDYDASANDGWVHAAFVYDGSADLGQIYLDGVLDWEGNKRAPNGNGNLIIGGRNGGGNGYVGLVDEVAVWDIPASADIIAALAAGGSPLDAGPVAENPFRVTTFSYNVGAGDLDISWSSNAGKSYGLQYSVDLATWVDLDVTVEADGDTANFQLPGDQNPLVGQANVYLRVYEK